MPMLDLSLVTTTLLRLLERYVPMSPVWGGTPPVGLVITGDPPDLVRLLAGDHVLACYLFHVDEDPARKNAYVASGPGDGPPIRFQPLGLNLFYLVAAYGGSQPNQGAYRREQKLLGIAMKGLHDHPILDRTTVIANPAFAGDELAFPPELLDERDRFRLTLHPLPLEAASQMWQAADVPRRLAAMYQVSVALLEPEPVRSFPLPVLQPVVRIDASAPPVVTGTEGTVTFVDAGGTAHAIQIAPALVVLGETFTIRGTRLAAATLRAAPVDGGWDPPSADVSSWIAARTDDRIDAIVGPVDGQEVVPGVYRISAVVGGAEAAGTIAIAAVATVGPASVAPGGTVQLTGGPFAGPGIRTVDVALGPIALRPTIALPLPGEFRVVDVATIDVVVPTARPDVFSTGRVLPVRVVVNGIPSKPGPRLTVA